MSDSKLFKLLSYLSSGFELSTLWILQSSTKSCIIWWSCIFFGFLRASSLPAWVTCICFSLFLFPPSVLLPQPPFIPPLLLHSLPLPRLSPTLATVIAGGWIYFSLPATHTHFTPFLTYTRYLPHRHKLLLPPLFNVCLCLLINVFMFITATDWAHRFLTISFSL